MKRLLLLLATILFAACTPQLPRDVTVEVLNPYTPVKNQGSTQLCWAYAMLSTIETEHMRQGDSINLSMIPVMQTIANNKDEFSPSGRAMGQTLLNMVSKYGIYSDVCNPDDYTAFCTTNKAPYGKPTVLQVPDNWEHNSFFNIHPDTLLSFTEQAVRERHGVCWEGDITEKGFSFERGIAETSIINGSTSDNHCMAIVGIAHDSKGRKYFIMKNSWGTNNPCGGLMLMSFSYFKNKTIAVFIPA